MKIKESIHITNIEEKLFFLIGLTATWTALQVPVAGVQISIFNVITIIASIYHIAKKNQKRIYIREPFFTSFLAITVISCISCLIYLNGYWFKESFKATMKFLLVFLPLIFFYKEGHIKHLGKWFFKGLFYSCIVQLIWSVLQLIFWYKWYRVLNEEVFGNILHIQTTHSWLTWHSGFRTTGLSWESANLGISLVVGFFLSRSIWMKSIFFIGLIFCGSRSALLTLMASLFIVAAIRFLRGHTNIRFERRQTRLMLYGMLALIVVGILAVNYLKIDLSIFVNTFNTFIERITKGFSGQDASAGRHMDYYVKIPEVLKKSNIVQVLFGYGTSCSGHPYTSIFNKSTDPAYVWNVESDIITILVGNGILGFASYYLFVLNLIYKSRKKEFDYFAITVCVTFAGVMYLYVRTWVTLMIVFLAAGTELPKYSGNILKKLKVKV